MPQLPRHPDMEQLRRQARELHRAARDGQPEAVARLRAVGSAISLSASQLALAREYGFPSWGRLKGEVERVRGEAVISFTSEELSLVDGQYADRPHLREVLDALLSAAGRLGDVHVVVRRRQISLVGPLRTFAMVQSTSRERVDVALRLAVPAPGGRVTTLPRGVEYRVRLELRSVDDVDADAIAWLQRAYDEAALPRPRRQLAPRVQPAAERTVRVVIEGFDLPGRTCNPDADGHLYQNIHVGLQSTDTRSREVHVVPPRPWALVDLVPGDAPQARWTLDVIIRRYPDGYDFRGPSVRGPRGARKIGLSWGELSADGTIDVFRGLGLHFGDVPPALLERALHDRAQLVARLGLTDAKGNPRCASVRPPDVAWSVQA